MPMFVLMYWCYIKIDMLTSEDSETTTHTGPSFSKFAIWKVQQKSLAAISLFGGNVTTVVYNIHQVIALAKRG